MAFEPERRRRQDCTYAGKPLYEGSNSFALSLGIAPSVGTVTMLASDQLTLQWDNSAYDLVLNDAGTVLTVRGLYMVRVVTEDPVQDGDSFVQVDLADERSLWAAERGGPVVDGYYNVLQEDGIHYRADTVNGATPWTFDEIIQHCLDALGCGITAETMVAWIPQNVEWEGDNAAGVLAHLLEQAGWEIVRHPDGAYALLDLSTSPAVSPPSDATLEGDSTERADRGHHRPATLALRFRTVVEAASSAWTPVLRYHSDDGATASSYTSDTSTGAAAGVEGEWGAAADVLKHWGVSLDWAERVYYAKGNEDRLLLDLNGTTALGHRRLQQLRHELYRYWRYSGSDRASVLPLIPLRATTGQQTGREQGLDAQVVAADWHYEMRADADWVTFFPKVAPARTTVRLPCRIVNAAEAIVEVLTPRPLAAIVEIQSTGDTQVSGSSGAAAASGAQGSSTAWDGAFMLVRPTAPTIQIAYYKKNAGAPASVYVTETLAVGSPNNGQTALRVHDTIVAREVGGAVVNTAELTTAAQAYLTAWRSSYTLPEPRAFEFAGLDDAFLQLTASVRAIEFRFEAGITTAVRVNSDRTPDRYGIGTSAHHRALAVAGQAAAHRAVVVDGRRGSGGTGHVVGPLGGTVPALRDFAVRREVVQHPTAHALGLVNPQYAGILIAEDLRPGPSGAVPSETTTTTGGGSGFGKPTTTGGLQGGTVTSG